jgi:predicted DNA binding CopG/RHH family protein
MDDKAKITWRLPVGLIDRIKAAASAKGQTLSEFARRTFEAALRGGGK